MRRHASLVTAYRWSLPQSHKPHQLFRYASPAIRICDSNLVDPHLPRLVGMHVIDRRHEAHYRTGIVCDGHVMSLILQELGEQRCVKGPIE